MPPKSRDNIFVKTLEEFKAACWAFFHTQGFWKYFLIAFGIYLLGIFSLIRADVYYIDDLNRSIIGYKEWDNFSRYISYYLSTFMHMDTILADVSPLTQLVAIAFLSFASLILVWSIREVIWKNEESQWESTEQPYKKRLTTLAIIASIPIGLSPYFLEELSFKYDSPYMALSVLFSVLPFVFIHHIRAYIPVAILSSLGMCMTYQASSGVEIILVLFFGFLMFNQTNAGIKKTLTFIGVSFLTYATALGIFKVFIMHPFAHTQAGTSTFPLSELPSGFISNMQMYLGYLWSDFDWTGVKICFFALMGVFLLSIVYQSKRSKILALLLGALVLSLGIMLSYGVYLVLAEPLQRPRAFIGIGVWAAAMAVYVVSAWRGWAYKQEDTRQTNSNTLVSRPFYARSFFVISAVVVGFFSWSLIVFANAYGNALSQQDKYQAFRLTILLQDLVNVMPKQKSYKDYTFRIKGWITASPVLENSSKHNPLMKRLVKITDGKYWVRTAMKHYGWGDVPEEQPEVVVDAEDFDKLAENPKCNPATAGRLKARVDNIFHLIEVYPECTIIEFKGKDKYPHAFEEELLRQEEEKLKEEKMQEEKMKKEQSQKKLQERAATKPQNKAQQ